MLLKLKALRINSDLSLEDMAKLLNVGKSTVSRWERGEIHIPMKALDQYCAICHADQETINSIKNNLQIRKENTKHAARNKD